VDPTVHELVDLLLRWLHLIAGIMWIGNSLLFNWLDRNLVMPKDPKPGLVGEIWMVHSGGFYQVEKKFLPPSGMPAVLHWFKWQSYTTWMSGFALLWAVYYLGGGSAFLVDPQVANISHTTAVGIGLGAVLGTFAVYDLIWRSPLRKNEALAGALCLAILAGEIFALTHLLSGRAAYIHVGALLGTCMSGNVFFHIIPSQRELVKATIEGREQDPRYGAHAKQRSIHNNYITFPVLFIMLSNHFAGTYGSSLNWAILMVLMVGGALVRHFMNIRFTFQRWLPALAASFIAASAGALFLMTRTSAVAAVAPPVPGEHIAFSSVQIVLQQRCLPCHSATPKDDQWKVAPNGIMFDRPEQVKMYSERIKARAVISKTMPLGNKTGMTQDERDLLARWFLAGATVE